MKSFKSIAAQAASSIVLALVACGGGGGDTGGGGDAGGGGPPALEKPAITTQPASQSAVTGSTATFTVQATGSETLDYQWKKNGMDIIGATSSTYTTPATTRADNGALFSVAVGNTAGTVTSSEASLTVTSAPAAGAVVVVGIKPAISTQPAAQTVVIGTTVTFSVSATGTAPLIYQWKKNGINIHKATDSTYTTPAAVSKDDGDNFSVEVTNSAGSVTSNEARLGVSASAVEAPAITTQPLSQTVALGNTATFTVAATGTTLIYQWQKGGTDISGATSSSYDISNTTSANDGEYSVVVSNSAGAVTSSNATLTVSRYSLVANGSGGFYDKTECVKDNKTGLIWEGKTASPGTSRLGTSTYTNYDGTGVGQKPGGGNADPATEINVIGNSTGYLDSVNAGNGLCGFTTWRLPESAELLGIVDQSQAVAPAIDSNWFPNTHTTRGYWSKTPVSGSPTHAYRVNFTSGDGLSAASFRNDGIYPVRLVRCAAVLPATCASN